MINKKLSWGRSNGFILIFTIMHFSLPAMDQYDPYSYQCLKNKENTQHNEYRQPPELTEEQKKTYYYMGNSWKTMMEIFKDAPAKAKLIVHHLQNPGKFSPAWRSAFFVGDPGTGKTVTATAIPHILNWHFDFIPSTVLLGSYRNQAKERLHQHLKRAVSENKKVIVIIDEIHRLLENFDSKNHDTDATASDLWMFLDSQRGNPNFFLIGIMNRDNKIPEPMKNRIEASSIEFKPITNPIRIRQIFKSKLESDYQKLDKECIDADLDECITTLGKVTPRTYENLELEVSMLTSLENPYSKVRSIKKKHILQAIDTIKKSRERMEVGIEHLTEEEWREFHAIQNKIIDVQLQCAQKIPMSINMSSTGLNGTISRAPGLDLDEAIKILEKELSEDQKRLYKRVMKRDYLIDRKSIDQVEYAIKHPIEKTQEVKQEAIKKAQQFYATHEEEINDFLEKPNGFWDKFNSAKSNLPCVIQ